MSLPALVKDLAGQRFGRLTVLSFAGTNNGRAEWLCACDCGAQKTARQSNLQGGNVSSCGCYRRALRRTHGETIGGRSPRFRIWVQARARAKREGVEFSIALTDFVVPEVCPLLDIRLRHHSGVRGPMDDTPSLDRMDASRGYVPGNVWIISNRANRIKSDATIEELETLARNLRAAYERTA